MLRRFNAYEAQMSFSKIIGRWPNSAALAEALNKARPPASPLKAVTPPQVRGWRHRDMIPPARFSEVAAAAQAYGFTDVTEQALNDLYKGAPAEQPPLADPGPDASEYR